MEVAYTCTLFKAEALGLKPYGYSGFTNQDRYFSIRFRALKEGQFWRYMPAIVFGTSDPFTSSEEARLVLQKETDIIVVSMQRPPAYLYRKRKNRVYTFLIYIIKEKSTS